MSQTENFISLVSQDDEIIQINLEIAYVSNTLKSIVKEFSLELEKPLRIPLRNINTRTLVKIIEFCRHEVEVSKKEKFSTLRTLPLEEQTARQKNWKTSFFRISDSNLFQLTTAASFLGIQGLLDQSTKIIARKLTKKDIFHIKKNFNIRNNFK